MKFGATVTGVLVLVVCALGASAAGQTQGQENGEGKAAASPAAAKVLQNYETICQPCHGPKGDSPLPPMSLNDGEWLHGSSTKEIVKTITEGVPGTAMLPNKDKLTEEEILELAKLVRSFDPTLTPEKGSSR